MSVNTRVLMSLFFSRLLQSGDPLLSPFRKYHLNYSIGSTDQVKELEEWGDYSTNFSFRQGQGLPGRVYGTNKSEWQVDHPLNDTMPELFAICRACSAAVLLCCFAISHAVESRVVSPSTKLAPNEDTWWSWPGRCRAPVGRTDAALKAVKQL